MRRLPLVLLALAAGGRAQVHMNWLGTIDLSATAEAGRPEFIGDRPAAIAWNGSSLWVGGTNLWGATSAITRIDHALTTPVANPAFGIRPAGSGHGYTGLDTDGTTLVAAFDGGEATPWGICAFGPAGTERWRRDARGCSGVAFDPGFLGSDAGVGWLTFGSPRRALQDTATGADLHTTTTGMNVAPTPGTFWRDVDFDDTTGDVWLRRGNRVITATRAGGNSVREARIVVDATPADFVGMQNLAFARTAFGSLVFWNDRASPAPGQPLAAAIRCCLPDGTPVALDWGAFASGDGDGAYDFGWDPISATLAICDPGSHAVHVFAIARHEAYGTGCPGLGGITPTLAVAGDSRAGLGTLTFTLGATAPASVLFIALGAARDQATLPLPGNTCPLLIRSILPDFLGPVLTGAGPPGSGLGTGSVAVPPATRGFALVAQGLVLQHGELLQTVTSNAVATIVP